MPRKAKTTPEESEARGSRDHPIMLRMSDAELESLEMLERDLVSARHPALDALGGSINRSALLRLVIHRGMRALREEMMLR